MGDQTLVGSSPEVMVRLTGNRVELRPIAGTRPRGANEVEDRKLADELLSDEYRILPETFIGSAEPAPDEYVTVEERKSVPELNENKLRNILLYILERCAGKPNVGETVLYKLLYFCDFNYYEIYEEHLTGSQYKKLSYGPVPHKMSTILNNMASSGQLQKVKTEYYGKPQTRFLPLMKPDLTRLSAAEKDVIDSVIALMSDWSARMISDYSHNDKPWKATELNDYVDYELVFYRSPPYSVRTYEEDEQDKARKNSIRRAAGEETEAGSSRLSS